MSLAQMCTVDDIIGGLPCLRVAVFEWQPQENDHPVFLCRYHAEPFTGSFPQPAPLGAGSASEEAHGD